MPGVNPIVLIQMLINYRCYSSKKERRVFAFQKNNMMRVHKETDEELARRKSLLSPETVQTAETSIRKALHRALHGRLGDSKVWIDPKLKRIMVPLDMAAGNSGFGILPTGSRIPIPKGKFIRAFTYWEKVKDIDLSGFLITNDWEKVEFSWRSMYGLQSDAVTFSGDQVNGYNGGSEYFDINLDLLKKAYPFGRYLVFCDNVYSEKDFNECDCRAGFMIRDEKLTEVPNWKGEIRKHGVSVNASEIFDPKTVATSFRVSAASSFAYLFAIDLETREMIWLNMNQKGNTRVAGEAEFKWLDKYLKMADAFNIENLYAMAGTWVEDAEDADILVTDNSELETEGKQIIHSWDYEKMLELLK